MTATIVQLDKLLLLVSHALPVQLEHIRMSLMVSLFGYPIPHFWQEVTIFKVKNHYAQLAQLEKSQEKEQENARIIAILDQNQEEEQYVIFVSLDIFQLQEVHVLNVPMESILREVQVYA